MSSMGVTMFMVTPSSSAWRLRSRKLRSGGPPLLLIKMSGVGHASSSAAWPSLVETSAITGVTVAPVVWRISAAVCSSSARLRPLITRMTPASPSACAQPRPRPWLEAQTIAVRPRMPKSIPLPLGPIAINANESYSPYLKPRNQEVIVKVPIERIQSGPRMSQVVVHNKTVYLSGQVAEGARGLSVTLQTQAILSSIDRLLAHAKTDKSQLLQATIWLTDMGNFSEMNKV